MVRGKGTQREILTPTEKEGLLSQRRELEDSIKERKSYGIGTSAERLDIARIQREIRRIDKAIADRRPPKLTDAQKDKLMKEAIVLEEKLKEGLPTRHEMDFPVKNPGAVRKHLRWVERNQFNIERWRYIQRLLNPYDPKYIETMRKEK